MWLTYETLLWLIQTNWPIYGIVRTMLMALFLLLLLYAIFRLLFLQQFLLLGLVILVLLAYVLWRLKP